MFANVTIPVDQNLIFCLVFVGAVAAVSVIAAVAHKSRLWWLRAEAVVVGAAILYLTGVVFKPLFARTPGEQAQAKLELPAYDHKRWHAFPVQVEGRTKPFETAAREAVRQITGREKFEGQDAVAVVVQWMLAPRGAKGDQFLDWENKPFILCDHQDLRRMIYAHLEKLQEGGLTEEQLHGKYVSPSDLRDSPGLKELVAKAEAIRAKDREKASQLMSPEERKAEEVAGRLVEFDSISQYSAGNLGEARRHPDPFHVVALDRVPSGAWFSVGELREIREAKGEEEGRWRSLIYKRLEQTPQLYISPERQQSLREFQDALKSEQGLKAVDELAGVLNQRNEQTVQEFLDRYKDKPNVKIGDVISDDVFQGLTEDERKQLGAWIRDKVPAKAANVEELARAEIPVADLGAELREVYAGRAKQAVEALRQRVKSAVQAGYRPDKPEYRMLHLDYLEARYPDLYKESLVSQPFPAADADRVLAAHSRLVAAYRSGSADQFDEASQQFFDTTRAVSEQHAPYPGEDTVGIRLAGLLHGRPTASPSQQLLDLEMRFNHVQPFMWAWVIMLVSALCFVASMTLHSRLAYGLGFTAYLASLGFQGFGFLARIAIAGRPPVSNMYETVVWVSFMSAVFALILELVYRRKVIALAGAMVATLGLVLADQLPLALDPKINPIVPVLRSNYWLTIHVLTIVSSYAGGTLAWGLGNIALALLAFGNPRREVLRTLSQYTYRAVQIAVLLLAAGTFLGGWWAAESWGRFWGWDPKEVWALIALVCYVIPLHARYIGWVKDFGLAVSAVLCYAAIVMSWYGVNFVLGAGLHSYGFGGGGPWWVFWAGLINVEWVLVASIIYLRRTQSPRSDVPERPPEYAAV
jgi:ABC-type transport system involved in cytochrome c biogenesis permease subunit